MALQGRCAAQRMQTTQLAASLLEKGVVFDRAVTLGRSVAVQPIVLGTAAVLTLVVGPRRLLNWAMRGAAVYGLTRRIFAALGYFAR